jgi:hypothetical protein
MPAPSTNPWGIRAQVETPVDHLAQNWTLLGDRHRPRNRDDAKAIPVADHGFERVGRFSEASPPEGGIGHAAHQIVDRRVLGDVEGGQWFEAVVVSFAVIRFISSRGVWLLRFAAGLKPHYGGRILGIPRWTGKLLLLRIGKWGIVRRRVCDMKVAHEIESWDASQDIQRR